MVKKDNPSISIHRFRYAVVVMFFVVASVPHLTPGVFVPLRWSSDHSGNWTLHNATESDNGARKLSKNSTSGTNGGLRKQSSSEDKAAPQKENSFPLTQDKVDENNQVKLNGTSNTPQPLTTKDQTSAKNQGEPTKSVTEKLQVMGLEPIYSPALHATDAWKSELFQRLDRIRVACGGLCQLNSIEEIQKHATTVKGALLPMVTVPNVDCPRILSLEEIDAADITVPSIPEELLDFFTLQKAYGVSKHRKRKDIYLGGESEKKLWSTGNVWTKEGVVAEIGKIADGTATGSYGVPATTYVRDKLKEIDMKGKSVLVIGSSHPWVEAICLFHGAANVTTLEYGKIVSKHPQIETMTPDEFRAKYVTGELEVFDGVVSHSSLEHSGLGRYGDALNPWGDILGVARAWCVTKQGGFMYLGLPTGKDMIFSNWHRTYGRIRWPLIAANWRPLDSSGEFALDQHLWRAQTNGGFGFIFRKENPSVVGEPGSDGGSQPSSTKLI